jgi:hypothetical protein
LAPACGESHLVADAAFAANTSSAPTGLLFDRKGAICQ